MKTIYFGCKGETGHYLYIDGKRQLSTNIIPWDQVDGVLCPFNRKAGSAKLHHKDGWTALAFWDYSIDKRPGSNSVFFIEGIHGFYHMIQFGKNYFPEIMKRFDFPIVERE